MSENLENMLSAAKDAYKVNDIKGSKNILDEAINLFPISAEAYSFRGKLQNFFFFVFTNNYIYICSYHILFYGQI